MSAILARNAGLVVRKNTMFLFKKSVKPSSDFLRKLGVDEPLFILPNGRKVYSVLGASPEGDPDNEGTPEEDKTDDDSSDDDNPDDSEKDKQDDDTDKSDLVPRNELEKALRRMAAADRRADENAAKIKEFEDKNKSELERATEQADTVKQENDQLKTQVRSLQIGNAFLSSNKYTWHDPEDVLAEVQKEFDKIETDENGVVTKKSLVAVLDNIAKRKPHWIKPASNGPSGEPGPGRSNNHKDDKTKRQELVDKFPALRKRR